MESRFLDRLRVSIKSLSPGYYALVMGTGIVSIGMKLAGFDLVSWFLMWLCALSYIVVTTLNVWRWRAERQSFQEDFADPRRAFSFFTFVAGTNVLGVRLSLNGWYDLTAVLLVIAFIGWVILGYIIPWVAFHQPVRDLLATANGTWFIWVVGCQSVALASASLEPASSGAGQRVLALLSVIGWSVGLFLYGAVGIIVMLRVIMYELRPIDLGPPYWVAMGACAIAAVAGGRITQMTDVPMADVIRELATGLAVLMWAFATWLIPALLALGWWRHIQHRVPLVYEAAWWSMVFPLGMYAVAGLYLGRVDKLPIVRWIGSVELWVAFTVLVITLAMMTLHSVQTVVRRTPSG